MKIDLTKHVSENEHALSAHIILECLTDTIVEEFKRLPDTDHIVADICFTINGHELDFEVFCKHWESQVERMIKEEASELICNKFSDVSELLYDLEERLKKEVDKRLEDWEKE